MARTTAVRLCAVMVVASLLAALGARAASAPDGAPQRFSLKAGQEVTLPITIDGQRVVLGVPRQSKLGTAQPKDGEITVGLTPGDKKTLYSQVLVTEKTSVPIDFVATGLIGEIKIDERVICGRLDQPTSIHIGSGSCRGRLATFEGGNGAPFPWGMQQRPLCSVFKGRFTFRASTKRNRRGRPLSATASTAASPRRGS